MDWKCGFIDWLADGLKMEKSQIGANSVSTFLNLPTPMQIFCFLWESKTQHLVFEFTPQPFCKKWRSRQFEVKVIAFQIEMTRRAISRGGSVAEIPITFIERVHGVSKMSFKSR
jgi:hypothetical protein